MARTAKRSRLRLNVVAQTEAGLQVVCRTRDVSTSGLFVETPTVIEPGTRLELSFLDQDRGEALVAVAEVARVVPASADGRPGGLGLRLMEIPEYWPDLVHRAHNREAARRLQRPQRRLVVLVVGDDERRRGALALYVQSGWDVRFASDVEGAREAIAEQHLDAVIAEQQLDDERWLPILDLARESQPEIRRIIRAPLEGRPRPEEGPLVLSSECVLDADAGLEALLEALAKE